jgi:hypothetical protein
MPKKFQTIDIDQFVPDIIAVLKLASVHGGRGPLEFSQ